MGKCSIVIDGQSYEIGSDALQEILAKNLNTKGVLVNRDLSLLTAREKFDRDKFLSINSIADAVKKVGILFKQSDVQQKNRLQLQYRNMTKHGILTINENMVTEYLIDSTKFMSDYGDPAVGGADIATAIDNFIAANSGRNISISEIVAGLLKENNKLGLRVSNIEKSSHEIVFPKIGQTAFMLDDDVQVSQVNEEYFKEKLINKLSPPSRLQNHYNYFLRSEEGEHLYILVKGSKEHLELEDGRLTKPRVEVYTKTVNGEHVKMLSERETGEDIMPEVSPNVEYRELTVSGIKHKYLVIPNAKYLPLIHSTLLNKKGSNYTDIVNSYTNNTTTNTIEYLRLMMDTSNNQKQANKYKAKINLISLYTRGNKDINAPISELVEYITESLNEFKANPELITSLRETYVDLLNTDPEKYGYVKRKIDLLDNLINYMNKPINFTGLSPQDFTDIVNTVSYTDHILKTKFMKEARVGSISGLQVDSMNQLMSLLDNEEDLRLEQRIARTATELNSSFKLQLNLITARIPGQDKQSFQATKVVAFLNTKNNLALVNLYNYWLTGADNDIDKIYNMTYYVGRNGKVINWSNLFRYDDEKFLDKSLELPVPDQTVTRGVLTPSGYQITANDIPLLNEVEINGVKGLDLPSFSRYVDILNGLYNNGWRYSFEMGVTPDTATLDYLINNFNNYDDYKTGDNESKAIINKYIKYMFQSSDDIANQAHHYSPIEIEITKNAAKKSSKGAAEKTVDFNDPTKIAEYKNINADGKSVIGITATGLKIYGALTMYYFKKIMSGDFSHMNFKQPLVTKYSEDGINITVNGVSVALASLNVESLSPEFLEQYIKYKLEQSNELSSEYNEEEIRFLMETLNLQERASLVLSALLSAATDNAKELVLTKINAGPDMASLYIYSIFTGNDFEEFANLMVSPEADFLAEMWKPMILDELRDNRTPGTNLSTESSVVNYIMNSSLGKTLNKFKIAKTISNEFKKYAVYTDSGTINTLKTITNFITGSTEEERTAFVKTYNDSIQVDESEFGKQPEEEEGEDYSEGELGEDEENEEIEEENEDDFGIYDADEDMYDEEMSLASLNKKMEVRFYRLFDEARKTIKKMKTLDLDKLNQIAELHKSASILKVMGGILKINQGIEADPYLFLNKIDLINKFIGKNITEGNRYSIPNEYLETGTFYFDFIKFLTDDDYKNKSINLFSKLVPNNYNILDVIDKSEHFKAMLNGIVAMHNFYMKTSYRYRVIYNTLNGNNNIYRDMILGVNERGVRSSINENIYQGIDKFVSQMIIQNYFESGNTANGESVGGAIEVIIPAGNYKVNNSGGFKARISDEKATVDFNSKLNTLAGRIEFVNYMENEVFPNLIMGYRRMADGEIVKDENLLSNIFVSELNNDIIVDRVTGDSYEYYKPGMNLLNIKSQEDKNKFEQYKNDFSALNNLNYYNVRITDLIYLYNLIVNNDAFSKSSFTAMYEKTGSMLPSSSLYYEFKDFVESMDARVEDDIHDYEGIQFYGVAETVDYVPWKTKPESKKYIKTHKNGEYKYYVLNGSSYDEIELPKDVSEKHMLIQRNRDFSVSRNIITKRNVDKFLSDFLKNGIFDYDINCD